MKTVNLQMDPKTAASEIAKWKQGKTVQDQLLVKAYRTLVRGGKLIDLHESFRISGCDEEGRPRLAFCRADASRVDFSCGDPPRSDVNFRSDVGRHSDFFFPCYVFPGIKKNVGTQRARVPIIPPEHRRSNLGQFRILFEAAWNQVTEDPMLLEPLGGSIYRVIAHWDLTVIEQAVLRGRR